MSLLVLGGAQLGGQYGATNQEPYQPLTAERLVECALDHGVRQFDTARAYGGSEEVIGRVLQRRGLDPAELVTTKLDPLESIDHSDGSATIAAVRDSVEASRRALRCDRLGTVLLHRAHHLRNEFIIGEIDRQRRERHVGRIGASLARPTDLDLCLEREVIEHVQVPLNLLDGRWSLEVIPPRVAVHARSIFLQGLLLEADARFPSLTETESDRLNRLIDDACSAVSVQTRLEFCLAYAKGVGIIDGVVVGAATPNQFIEILQAWEQVDPLSATEIDSIRASLATTDANLVDPSQWPPRAT